MQATTTKTTTDIMGNTTTDYAVSVSMNLLPTTHVELSFNGDTIELPGGQAQTAVYVRVNQYAEFGEVFADTHFGPGDLSALRPLQLRERKMVAITVWVF